MFMSTSSIRTVHNEANSSPGFMMRNDGTMTDNVIILLTVYLPVFSVMFMSTSSIRTVHNEANSSPGFMMRNDGTMTDNVII